MPQTVVLTLKPEEAADVHRYAPLAARAAGVAERDAKNPKDGAIAMNNVIQEHPFSR